MGHHKKPLTLRHKFWTLINARCIRPFDLMICFYLDNSTFTLLSQSRGALVTPPWWFRLHTKPWCLIVYRPIAWQSLHVLLFVHANSANSANRAGFKSMRKARPASLKNEAQHVQCEKNWGVCWESIEHIAESPVLRSCKMSQRKSCRAWRICIQRYELEQKTSQTTILPAAHRLSINWLIYIG